MLNTAGHRFSRQGAKTPSFPYLLPFVPSCEKWAITATKHPNHKPRRQTMKPTADFSDTVTVSEDRKDTEWLKIGSGSWYLNGEYEGKTGKCGSRITTCDESGSPCQRGE
jgi:hypothetical protein